MPQVFPGEVFAQTSDFDAGMRQLMPGYDEMLEAVARCVPSTSRRILELGCGTGELSKKILNRCRDAQIIALDYSPRMIEFAQKKMVEAGYQQWSGLEADFGEWANNPEKFDIGTEFDACVSSLAIHHLSDEMKAKLFQRIAKSLRKGGSFWNADPVLSESPILEEIYKTAGKEWTEKQGSTIEKVRSRLASNSDAVDYAASYGYSSQDQLATLDTQLQMLAKAGFKSVAVPWKYYKLAVFGGFI
ncbi:methylase involved in ubiquinone/menaquinone biosynthesis [Rivularia sp. PCC 7116]|uniref:class I SAM-dependent methyltransferase n=1 Tax=Rivularia sp. PCC 7116 TaxID=373994 RepID=UPI00029F2849|nr:class I SAM-dependent methyltransferase [Rivularia sp. PCC 7116]AFY58110.1 methylase involved in ubiquinone/menaquinone biosynthesis [Rivularia sp. PCC 7116]